MYPAVTAVECEANLIAGVLPMRHFRANATVSPPKESKDGCIISTVEPYKMPTHDSIAARLT